MSSVIGVIGHTRTSYYMISVIGRTLTNCRRTWIGVLASDIRFRAPRDGDAVWRTLSVSTLVLSKGRSSVDGTTGLLSLPVALLDAVAVALALRRVLPYPVAVLSSVRATSALELPSKLDPCAE